MRKERKLKITAFVISAAITVTSLMVGVLASGGLEKISAYLNKGIKISYNDEIQNFTDANGEAVYPVTYNGTTYLPVRAMSGLVNVPVNWNASTNTVELGYSNPEVKINIAEYEDAKTTDRSWIIGDKTTLSVSGKKFDNGVGYEIWNSGSSAREDRAMYLPVHGRNTLEFDVYATADAKIYVFDENYRKIASFRVKANTLTSNEVDIAGCESVAFQANSIDHLDDEAYAYFFEPVVYITKDDNKKAEDEAEPEISDDKKENANERVYIAEYKDAKTTKHSWVIKDKATLTVDGKKFDDGVGYEIWNSGSSAGEDRAMYLPVNDHNTLEFTAYATEDAKIYVFDENYRKIAMINVEANALKTYKVNISGCESVAFQADSQEYLSHEAYAYFFEPVAYTTKNNTLKDSNKYIAEYKSAKTNKYSWVIRDEKTLSVDGKKFETAVGFTLWNDTASAGEGRAMYLPTNGCGTLKFTVYATEDAEVYVFGDDYKKIASFNVSEGEFVDYEIDVSDCENVAFQANAKSHLPGEGYVYFLEPTVSK